MGVLQADRQTQTVLGWEDDPGSPGQERAPIPWPKPDLMSSPLPTSIYGKPPPPDGDRSSNGEFLYWNLAESLFRASAMWGELISPGTTWHPDLKGTLQATLDSGEDLNAFYDRVGLKFFHQKVADHTIFSGESPDVVCHEFGHALLDAIRPDLWGAAGAEYAAVHESFGDISALLTNLSIPSMRDEVLRETGGRLAGSSRLSRMAEQLGWAIRQTNPTAVDADCLRNASNKFFYRDPLQLPPMAPATGLSSEPHSFSRVFTGSILRALAGMFREQAKHDADALYEVSMVMGRLLLEGVTRAPLVPGFYAQIAAHMIAADQAQNGGSYGPALRAAFVRHGVLSPASSVDLSDSVGSGRMSVIGDIAHPYTQELSGILVDGRPFGVNQPFSALMPTHQSRYAVAGAAPDVGSVETSTTEAVARSYVEDLFRRGRVAVPTRFQTTSVSPAESTRLKTHEIAEVGEGLTLARRLFI
jgi:hypothetical protein